MKKGLNIQELSKELIRQQASKRDFITPAQRIQMIDSDMLRIARDGASQAESFDMTGNFHRQIGTALQIPAKYYDKMRESLPDLLTENVNAWLNLRDSRQMIRTLDGRARAFLSDSYKRIDHYDIALSTLPILQELGDISFESTQITETRMYSCLT